MFKEYWGLQDDVDHWKLGAANASPWFAAALIGCPLSLPVNYWFGRRGGLMAASALIFASSVAAIFTHNWVELTCVRIVNGLGKWQYIYYNLCSQMYLLYLRKVWVSRPFQLPFLLVRLL
jgi:MFS family permease